MGVPSTSRKGKKAWRKNIDDTEIVAAIEEQTHQERRGPAVETLQDQDLFFIDKAPQASAPLPTARARSKREARPTRAQLILFAPQSIKPVTAHKAPPRKVGALKQQQQKQTPGQDDSRAIVVRQEQTPSAQPATELDLWEDIGPHIDIANDAVTAPEAPAPPVAKPVGPSSRVKKRSREPKPVTRIKAVEVDMPGCSYNPEHETHQDALAVLVATENKKLLKRELAPRAVPLTVDASEAGPTDELDRLLTEYDPADEEDHTDTEGDDRTAAAGPSDQVDDDTQQADGKAGTGKKTKKDRNRAARAAAEAKALEAKRALKRQRQALQQLPLLAAQVEAEEQEKEMKRLRKQAVEEEKALTQPPKLGKHKFEDLSVQVLTSDEVGHGLRRLKAFPMLATERFKSLQKRGLIEPRKPVGLRGPKRVVVYEKGARREKAVEGQAQLEELKRVNRAKAKKLAGR